MTQAPPQLHRGVIGAGGILLITAFATDCTYYTTALWQWANFSAWLITAGLIVTLLAVILLLINFATGRAGRSRAGDGVGGPGRVGCRGRTSRTSGWLPPRRAIGSPDAGDVLEGRGTVVDAYRKESKGKVMTFVVVETAWSDQATGEPVCTSRMNIIHRI